MNHTIFLLDEQTVNQIAAGEVVEKPSSVVKELVENSIDAKASIITIETKEGGKNSIRVTDNGTGIAKDQLHKVFMRHATSKLKNIDDLNTLYSNGFRGEALSSIAAVSKITLLTRTKTSVFGQKLDVEAGELVNQCDIGTQEGTSIIVKNLFDNIPARKKFLKSSSAENMSLNQIISQLSLSHPNIQFKWISDGKLNLQTPGTGNLLDAVRIIYGKHFSQELISLTGRNDNLNIYGLISKPSLYFPNRRKQSLFINRRYVRNHSITKSIEDAYKGILPIGKFPSFILFIDIEPIHLDVNIHPTKMEVKIESSLMLENFLYSCTRETLFSQPQNIIPSFSIKNIEKLSDTEYKPVQLNITVDEVINQENTSKKYFNQLKSTENTIDKIIPESAASIISKENTSPYVIMDNTSHDISITSYEPLYLDSKEALYFPSEHTSKNNNETDSIMKMSNPLDKAENTSFQMSKMHILGKVFGAFILTTLNKSFFIIDQHAAHERILYEKYLNMYRQQTFDTQMLLSIDTLDLSYEDMAIIEKNLDLFHEFGFELEPFGNRSILIKGVPILFNRNQNKIFIYEILELIRTKNKIDANPDFKNQIATMACRKAIKAHDSIEDMEILALLSQLEDCKEKYTCPHGRPIFLEFHQYDLEKLFKRVNP